MKFSNFYRICQKGSLALASVAIATPAVNAHNSTKYVGIPFVVAGTCTNAPGQSTAQFITVGHTLQLKLATNTQLRDAFAEIFSSTPGAPGRSTVGLPVTSSFSEGILTFNVGGLSPGATLAVTAIYTNNSLNPLVVNSNGPVTFPANEPSVAGVPVSVIFAELISSSPGATSSATLSNFTYNGKPLLFDTTLTITTCSPI